MKNVKLFLIACLLIGNLVGCHKDDIFTSSDLDVKMKEVLLSAGVSQDTRAALDTQTGEFTWQSADVISVLASDNKFYQFTLEDGVGEKTAHFKGSMPVGVVVAGVAIHPAVVANEADNTIYDTTTGVLNFPLASEWNYVAGQTNVPMVAVVEAEATEVNFRQVGGVIRFPVNTLPKEAKLVLTAKNMRVNGNFAVNTAELGTTAMVAETIEGTSTVTVNYSSEYSGQNVELNIPVATGAYTEFSLDLTDLAGNVLKHKDYTLNKTVNRRTLLVMNALDAEAVTVYPYFADARVIWTPVEGVTSYAIFVDDAVEPIVVKASEAETFNNRLSKVIGDFTHGTTHKVAVAHVVNGEVDPATKSEYVSFTTGRIMQMTNNTGTKFVCVGWDDVAIGVENSTVYDEATKRWSLVPSTTESNRNLRGYRVRLYAEDQRTLLYEEVPFSGQVDYGGAFSNSSWIGKIGGKNVLLPTALSFGWLEPGKKYYFQVQTLAEPVVFNSPATDCFEPETSGYTVSSTRGGSGWSKLVEVTTNAAHVASANEILYEGFDDMFLNNDLMNMAPAAVPQVLTTAIKKGAENKDAEGGYATNKTTAPAYDTWLQQALVDRKFSEQGFNTSLSAYAYGLINKYTAEATPRTLNTNAGSLEGWTVYSNKYDYRNVIPSFGNVRLGQSTSATGAAYVTLRTPAIESDKLSNDADTPCVVTLRVCGHTTDKERICANVGVYQYRNGVKTDASAVYTFSQDGEGNVTDQWAKNNTWMDASNYTHYPEWYEVKSQVYLRNGDQLGFDKFNPTINGESDYYKGVITIDEIRVEVGTLSQTGVIGERVYGTAPDNTNYDVWGLGGAMPVTFWMGPPALDNMNVDLMSEADISACKTAYFDPIVEAGYNMFETTNPYPNSVLKILEWCQEAGVKLFDKSIQAISYDGNVAAQGEIHTQRMMQYVNHPNYGGAYVGPDEPGVCQFPDIDIINDAYVGMSNHGKAHVVNLLPSYASASQLTYGASSSCSGQHAHSYHSSGYADYVKKFVDQVSVNCLMLDHYCLSKSSASGTVSRGNVKSKQYYDLDVFRHYSLEKRIPFLMITHGRPQWDKGWDASIANNDPTVNTSVGATNLPECTDAMVYDMQRWLVWSQIAMGSKGVSYFTYWTPGGFKGGPFSIHWDGTKTRMYDILTDINKEIQPIGSILMKCHADGAIITNPTGNFVMYVNEGVGLTNYGPVLRLNKAGMENVVAGCFRDASTGEYKVLVTHQSPATSDDASATPSIAELILDTQMVTKVKLHTVTLSNGHNEEATTVVTDQTIVDGKLTLSIPDGTAVLVEFPETSGKSYGN